MLGFRSKDIITDAFSDHVAKHSYNPVTDYFGSLTWDGRPRLDALLIDYLGAADTPYVRAATRKAFTAAVARAMEPGCKYDTMLILTGAQGLGKSTLLFKMGRHWFSDSIKTFEGKEASELVQGVLIVEIGELEAFSKSDISRIKQFLSQREDIFRAAYGRVVEWHKRRCVFFGTSNNGEYLRDKTGNRRFWPVDAGGDKTDEVRVWRSGRRGRSAVGRGRGALATGRAAVPVRWAGDHGRGRAGSPYRTVTA